MEIRDGWELLSFGFESLGKLKGRFLLGNRGEWPFVKMRESWAKAPRYFRIRSSPKFWTDLQF